MQEMVAQYWVTQGLTPDEAWEITQREGYEKVLPLIYAQAHTGPKYYRKPRREDYCDAIDYEGKMSAQRWKYLRALWKWEREYRRDYRADGTPRQHGDTEDVDLRAYRDEEQADYELEQHLKKVRAEKYGGAS
ncbi:hypothetical protein E1N52_03550 [Paraburkholderia guartelaensis]|uniref:Uncharacterized protein n=1 Tax=Paraburkholderia guartelaensis TaxID=2546446 RepID=A0A4R5LL02_9BURK|nr:hypothetical protein [Paraburkholderia guartelaensis]TDG10432.1 hypothetical protein E1N52_03550 [Paraburkholderia guartelaensis]